MARTKTVIKGIEVTPAQETVYRAMRQLRRPVTDQALVAYTQHIVGGDLASSGIRTRRAELQRVGLVTATADTITTKSGRKARLFRAV
jgi:hypothetical protein